MNMVQAHMNEVLLTRHGHIGLVTLNRPEAMNSLNSALCQGLRETLDALEDDDDIWVVVITGAGERAFCAGIDLRERKGLDKQATEEIRRKYFFPVFDRLNHMTKPMIAGVNGLALGGGCEIALASDIRIASTSAGFGQVEIKVGILASGGACQRLPAYIGMGRAKELLFTGRTINAQEAARIGLVSRVVAPNELIEVSLAVAGEITANAPVAVRQTKKCVDHGADIERGLEFDAAASWLCYQTEDRLEALAAFAEKRKPNFKNR